MIEVKNSRLLCLSPMRWLGRRLQRNSSFAGNLVKQAGLEFQEIQTALAEHEILFMMKFWRSETTTASDGAGEVA